MAIDPLEAAQRRGFRTGRSYFTAANPGSGANATYSTWGGNTQVQKLQGGVLSPENNPAYQAAINRPRLGRGDLTTIRLPNGGTTTVPTSSAGNVAQAVPGSQVTQIGNQFPFNYAANYRKGYGAPTPSVQDFAGGPALVQSGIANPVSNLTPAQRIQFGQGGFLDYLRSGPTSLAFQNALGGLGQNIANWFRPNPSSFGGTSAAGAPVPTATPIQTPSPSPTPTATPFKTASERGDLMNDINGTFYGGGHAPVPTPTPTPYQAPSMAYSEPRRYFDPYSGYA